MLNHRPAPYCLLDYRVRRTDDVRLPVTSEAVLYGDSLFSTLSVLEGVPVFLDAHIRRLNFSARELGYRTRLDPNRMRMALDNLIAGDRADQAHLRITLFNPGENEPGVPEHLVLLFPGVADQINAAELFPVNRRNLDDLSRHKSGNYLLNRRISRQLTRGTEALFLDEKGNLLEGTRSNLFLAIENRLLTPSREQGILPGICRGCLLGDLQLGAHATNLDLEALEMASEAFVCNSVLGIQPLNRIGQFSFGEAPGPLTRRAMASLETQILSDISRWF
ncbi:MAG: aminotransferase class IV [Calditrichaeota bacterium]|nr:aminotransferase class IV [Candidatus Cloacimonadota bacterium]MCA9787726.1 aminotransferase class IV [Candidatus Cloacimonadota bacterium]MCB1047168.1 aminotransferase class IV [Calditrichota bacterium]MCB9475038.1 aminotransferase class IV [Candidatus Delongbacteria bacterium]